MKKEDKLGDLSMQLSVDVLNMCKVLKKQGETVISNQISRSGITFSISLSVIFLNIIYISSVSLYLHDMQNNLLVVSLSQ